MTPRRNLHAVLVHESRECVIDLVQNLHHLDPQSSIVLYNGGPNPELLGGRFRWEEYGAVVHPSPRRMKWGWLHEFALDCMRFGLSELPFDTMTIVDSDQLALRAGYSEYLAKWLAGRTGVGLLGSAAPPTPGKPAAPPAVQAYREMDLWRPMLRRFTDGERKFAHWTFWPSTVFTAEAARGLVELWPDTQLQDILRRTKIWASEEVILPTLVALLGLSVEVNPCRHDLVRFRTRYTPQQLDSAFANSQLYWAHPIPRRYDDPLRARVRQRHRGYESSRVLAVEAPFARKKGSSGILSTLPILKEVRAVEGWLSDEEADLLVATAKHALTAPGPHRVVEIGSYCGKATLALGRVVEAIAPDSRIYAIDAHDGIVGSRDGKLVHTGPTREKLDRTLRSAGIGEYVEVRQGRSGDVAWEGPIRLLLVDGLHDYESVAEDFEHFERFVTEDGSVVFHDYADYFPGVRLFVDELSRSGRWQKVEQAGTLVVLRRASAETKHDVATTEASRPASPVTLREAHPRVTCIMPTANRRAFVPLALQQFVSQDYPDRELVVIDDGSDAVGDLIPTDSRIHYVRLDGRHSVGEKRNIACRRATGSVIVHWDDDDWSAPHRVSYQVAELERTGADIVGLRNVHYLEPASGRSWQYRYPPGARPWVAGNTLVYRRTLWEKQPFASVDVGEDARFVWSNRSLRVEALADDTFFVAMLHGRNVSRKQVNQRFWHPQPAEALAKVMGAEFGIYARLFPATEPRSAEG